MPHDLTFGDLQNTQVTLGGASYFKVLLDVNEAGGSKSLISLDQLQFYTSKGVTQSSERANVAGRQTTHVSSTAAVLGDMYAYIPTSDFAGSKTSDFVYL